MATVEEALKRAKEAGSGTFISLKNDGDKVIGCFVNNEVEIQENAWDVKASKYEAYTDEHKAKGVSKTPRFVMNFWVRSERVNKILKMNSATFETSIAMRQKYGDHMPLEIVRKGAKGDTKVQFLISPEKDPLSAEELAAMKAAELKDLKGAPHDDDNDGATDMASHDKNKGAGAATNGANGSTTQPSSDIIDAATSSLLISRLKTHPKAKIDQFMATFKIVKVKELKRADVGAAEALLNEFEGKPAVAPPPVVENDPFS